MVVTILRYLWASPTTLMGLLFVGLALVSGGRARVRQGAIESHGGLVSLLLRRVVPLKGGAMALTLGHVILGASAAALDVARAHEHIHVRQCERWGPFFLPAYVIASVVAAVRGGHFYRDNVFEREAYASTGRIGDGRS